MMLNIFSDGASRGNPGKASAAFVIFKNKQEVYHRAEMIPGTVSNNVAEYQGLLMASEWVRKKAKADPKFRHTKVSFFTDSRLVANQMNGSFKVNKSDLKKMRRQIIKNLKLVHWRVSHIPRGENEVADKLANEVLDKPGVSGQILSPYGPMLEDLKKPKLNNYITKVEILKEIRVWIQEKEQALDRYRKYRVLANVLMGPMSAKLLKQLLEEAKTVYEDEYKGETK